MGEGSAVPLLERAERDALEDLYRAAPPDRAAGAERIGGATVLLAPGLPAFFNRAFAFGIDELEPVKRGGYGGAIGYLSYTGDLDTCIHIRTVVVKDGVAHVQAGGGTVADAKPAYEYDESVAKSRAVREAVALACEQPDWP